MMRYSINQKNYKKMEEIKVGKNIYFLAYYRQESKIYYTKKHVWYIATYTENVKTAKKDILNIMLKKYGSMIHIKEYLEINAIKPSLEHALLHYYELLYNAEDDTYKFTLIVPYDD